MPDEQPSTPPFGGTVVQGTIAPVAVEPHPASGAEVPAPPGYELFEEIGRGGMGVVYRARDTRLNRDVAVKLLQDRFAAGSTAARRFVDEAQITGQLQHPGVPPLHELGALSDGRPFLAMKLIKGRTLDELLKERADPTANFGRFLIVFEAVCQAVAYAHSKGVIHRDLKPANVMVGAFGEVQVMDRGIAKVLRPDAKTQSEPAGVQQLMIPVVQPVRPYLGTRTGTSGVSPGSEIRVVRDLNELTVAGAVFGTPAYMAPEQAGGEVEKIDRRSDVFGLGGILCVMLTGKPPYIGPDSEAMLLMAIRGELSEALVRLDGCGAAPELVSLVKRCLAPNRDDRPADAAEVADVLALYRVGLQEKAQAVVSERAASEARRRERRRQVLWWFLAESLVILGSLVLFPLLYVVMNLCNRVGVKGIWAASAVVVAFAAVCWFITRTMNRLRRP
jgi:serine/threonine protein kinase